MKIKTKSYKENRTAQESISKNTINCAQTENSLSEILPIAENLSTGISRREALRQVGLASLFTLPIFSQLAMPLIGHAEETSAINLLSTEFTPLPGQLSIKGKVNHANGSPVKNASVEIIDKDSGGNGDDVIFNGTTDSNGNFSGTSTEWKDRNTTPAPLGKTIDVPDILILEARIKQSGNEITLPFFKLDVMPPGFSNSINVSNPLVVPWLPSAQVIGRVNGTPYDDPIKLNLAVKAEVDKGRSPVKIEIYGPDANFFTPLTKTKSEIEQWVKSRLQIPGNSSNALTGTEVFWIMIAIAIIILAVGITFIAVCVGLAVLYAIFKGYKNVSVNASQQTPGGGNTGIIFNISN